MFEQEVVNKDGVVKMVRANDLDDLNEAVQAAQKERVAVSVDINGEQPELELDSKPKRSSKK